MAILAAVRKGEAGRVAEAEGRPVDDLSHQGKCAHGASTDTWCQQQVLEILGPLRGCCGQRPAQAAGDDIAWANGVMRRHDEVQSELAWRAIGRPLDNSWDHPWDRPWDRPWDHPWDPERRELVGNAVGTQAVQEVELCLAGGRGSAVGEIDDVALARTGDCRMRGFNEALQALRQPMVTAGPPPFRRACPVGGRPICRYPPE